MAATEREAKEEDSWSDCHGTSWPQCLGPTKPPSVSISESADTAERFEPRVYQANLFGSCAPCA